MSKIEHEIIEVTGASVKLNGGSVVSVGQKIHPGDTLTVSSKVSSGVPSVATVKVRCHDGKIKRVPDGSPAAINNICPQPRKRGGGNPAIPYIISPRDTRILTDKPTFRWNFATGANSFTVTLRNGELEWTEQVSQERACQGNVCELSYPSDKPPLQPGVSYTLEVKADTNRKSTEDIPPGFTTLDEQEAEEVRTIAQQIKDEDLPATARTIKLADHYAERNLIAEAIEILEGLAKEEKSVAVYRRLGDLYSSIGLTREAEVAYNEAIQLPETAEDIQELAAVKAGLGEVKFALNDKDEAILLLEEAKVDYENLGDAQRAEELKERIDEITAM